jgi:hypothetical protein
LSRIDLIVVLAKIFGRMVTFDFCISQIGCGQDEGPTDEMLQST